MAKKTPLLNIGICLFFMVSTTLSLHHDWDVEISREENRQWIPVARGEPEVVVSKTTSPHEDTVRMESNNNVAALLHRDRLYLAWRTAPLHFAGPDTRLYVVSSGDNGTSWSLELEVFLGRDLREPFLLAMDERVYFFFFEGGVNPIDFEPLGLFRSERLRPGEWTEPEIFGHKGEVVWDIVTENGTACAQSYSGDYSTPGDAQDMGQLFMFFNCSTDGVSWAPAGKEWTYYGGLTELGWYFDLEGNIWGVGRNEDGDDSGWGSRTFFAPASDLSDWQWISDQSDPWIYESPKMFRHGSDLYLVARTDPGGPFWSHDNPLLNTLPPWEHHLIDLVNFSFRQHGTAIWRLDQSTGNLEKLLELPGCGDTAFPSIVRVSLHKFIIFNYSSPLEDCPHYWLEGQLSPNGTLIYSQEIEFVDIGPDQH